MGAAFGAATVERLIGGAASVVFFSNIAFKLATLLVPKENLSYNGFNMVILSKIPLQIS
jgi:hypothetical protein